MIEQTLEIATAHGATTTFIVHPERDGPHPVILFYMDAPAIREELRDMARRLASSGYYVVLPNLYYRAGVLELAGFATEADRKTMFDLMASINIGLIMSDTKALLAHIDTDPAASKGPMGAVGYCMSGQYAINAAAYYPDKVKAAASIYGVSLVTDAHDSPHLAAQKVQGEVYFACAEIDPYAPLEMVEALSQSVTANQVKGEVEIYPGVHHGFAFPQRAAYDKPAAERHWERLLALFKRNLA
ncbi:dienelactone hydrolase family protein [Phenylobacterium sp.]|uniref:dienelactone hydrolase family protein n=1 Tax=Phenylobacterium sp. TaxID=1871053 RepID=UPI00272068A4|nr:dienelactone hydrolase family protein [Phenylobacterium sp.]MDO8799717.1 dienelactone hydrolase family protein [Phenylobacterium sp.]